MFPTRAALLRTSAALLSCSLVLGLAGCGGSTLGGGQSGIVGQENPNPDGGLFIVDPNQSGSAARLHLDEVLWGRLVDVHEIDALGDTVPEPVYRDFLIEPSLRSDGIDYRIEFDRVAGRERLVVLAQKNGVADSTTFDTLLRNAFDALPVVTPKNDDGTSAPPFSSVPRNACLSLRFDDCLDDSAAVRAVLPDLVRVVTGYTPSTPYSARVVFDPNFGAVVRRTFRPTRVLVDFTVSEAEANAYPTAIDINQAGVPASRTSNPDPNLTVRIPSRIDNGSAQFTILSNLSGVGLNSSDNGPVDTTTPTVDIVRTMQTGNSAQADNGYLPDLVPPSIVGAWPLSIADASDDPGGVSGFDFLLDVAFTSVCEADLEEGDVIRVGTSLLRVSQDTALSGSAATDVPVRAFASVSSATALIGSGEFETRLDVTLGVPDACWVTFIPAPGTFPDTDVSPTARVVVRFDEPMDPDSLSPLDQFLVVQGPAESSSSATFDNLVLAEVLAGNGLTDFTFSPLIPIDHTQGSSEEYHVELVGPTDLAGLALPVELPFVDFTLNAPEATNRNGAIILRFDSPDEIGPDAFPDLRGQFFPDYASGILQPRPPSVLSFPADPQASPTVLGVMGGPNPTTIPGLLGVFPPLVRLGSRLQTVWRYCDFGWLARDETKYNLDVLGLSYRPPGGQVDSDFFERFEIVLGHSRYLPDELLVLNPAGQLIPMFPTSGLPGVGAPFVDNFLTDPFAGAPKIVHSRTLGYRIEPRDRFTASTGSVMMPFPLNRNASTATTYTWRDTAVTAVAGNGDASAIGVPVSLDSMGPDAPGSLAVPGAVPSIYLPLLLEFRCFQSDSAIGLNKFDVGMPPTASASPFFRVFSAGGVDTVNRDVVVDPDRETTPKGGFNPLSSPPGRLTATVGDNAFYYGQLDAVVRISRIHSAWMDLGAGVSPTYLTPVIDPPNTAQPAGTTVTVDYRGATNFTGTGAGIERDASVLDVYGELDPDDRVPTFKNGGVWSPLISSESGARYLQIRVTFANNIQTGLTPTLSAVAFPFRK